MKKTILVLALMLHASFCYTNNDDCEDKGYDSSLQVGIAASGTLACMDGVRRIWSTVQPCRHIPNDEEARLLPAVNGEAHRAPFQQIRFGLGEIVVGGILITSSWVSMGIHSHT